MKVETHPFKCLKRGISKSAWATPEYLTAEDWALAEKALATTTPEELLELVFESPERAEAFFYRIVGWAEGKAYMRDVEYARVTGWPGLQGHAFGKLREALTLHATPAMAS